MDGSSGIKPTREKGDKIPPLPTSKGKQTGGAAVKRRPAIPKLTIPPPPLAPPTPPQGSSRSGTYRGRKIKQAAETTPREYANIRLPSDRVMAVDAVVSVSPDTLVQLSSSRPQPTIHSGARSPVSAPTTSKDKLVRVSPRNRASGAAVSFPETATGTGSSDPADILTELRRENANVTGEHNASAPVTEARKTPGLLKPRAVGGPVGGQVKYSSNVSHQKEAWMKAYQSIFGAEVFTKLEVRGR